MAEPSRILLTGATGFCGAAGVRAFIRAGKIDKVTCIVRNAARAQEAVEIGARNILVVPDVMEVPKVLKDYDCVVNFVQVGQGFNYGKENQLAEGIIAALKARGGGTFVQLSGTGCVGKFFGSNGAQDGRSAEEWTDWAELQPYNPKRHNMERTVALSAEKTVRTALIRPPGIYGADGRSDVTIRPIFRSVEADGKATVLGDGKQVREP